MHFVPKINKSIEVHICLFHPVSIYSRSWQLYKSTVETNLNVAAAAAASAVAAAVVAAVALPAVAAAAAAAAAGKDND